MDLKKIIANNIYIIRGQNKLTQEEFVTKLSNKYTRSQLSHIETGKNMPSAEFIFDVSKAFNVDINWLLETHNKNYPDIELSGEEISFALEYRKLHPDAKESIMCIINMLNNKSI